MQLIIAEKPSVARDLARVLNVRPSGKAYFEGAGRVITWCVGHLVELEEPAAYDERWRPWRLDVLPMLPASFRLRPVAETADQLRVVRDLLVDRRFTEVVNACDAGREGELIFRYVYELCQSRLPIRRLWISSLTDEAIRKGFAALRPGRDYEALAAAARCRSEADWLVGMNATRAITLRHRQGGDSPLYSIGRVQTPTLGLLVQREKAIRSFVPRDYWEVRGRFAAAGGGEGAPFAALWFTGAHKNERMSRLGRLDLAEAVVERCRKATGERAPRVESVRQKTVREPPPLLFDLTSLQRTANKRFGMSATRTLEVAQSLYETHKLLTYPRTDSRHLSGDLEAEMPRIWTALADVPAYAPFATALLERPPRPGRRVFDDKKVQDHHAIIPTGKTPRLESLGADERRIFDLVTRRFLGVFFPDAEFALTELVVVVGGAEPGGAAGATAGPAKGAAPRGRAASARATAGAAPISAERGEQEEGGEAESPLVEELPPPPDRFLARGRVRLAAGWQAVAGIDGEERGEREGGEREGEAVQGLPPLREGDRLGGRFETVAKQTRPPPHYTEAALLGAMEAAGRAIEDETLRLAMKDCGLGTPATRAATIETLLKRGFVVRERKQLLPTERGMALIEALPVDSLASAELTGAWEARLARVARGAETRAAFMTDIVGYVREVVGAIRASTPVAALATAGAGEQGRRPGRQTAGAAGRASPSRTRRPGRAPGRRFTGGAKGGRVGGEKGGRAASGGRKRPPGGRTPPARPATVARSERAPAKPPFKAEAVAERGRTRRAAVDVSALSCPRCHQGPLITGKRGWGCGRWREGCTFVVWFEIAGRRLTPSQLRELVTRGKTREAEWRPDGGPAVRGRLVLDPHQTGGAALFVPG
ncbi:MAG TPA: DNA topoisomerase [Polyangia bacterium]|jgi:DNA topoisomerase-3|nr:DNA topoisomerase [Polyangia bacterium]